MRLIKTLIVAFAICPFLAQAHGGMTSSGGDNKNLAWESAWFLGEAPVSYCIEVAPTEKLTADQAKRDFESVVTTWKKYFIERTSGRDKQYFLNFNFQFESCRPTTLLKLYVGGDNAEITKAKALYQNPYSIAYRSEYDMKSAMGKGFIWFAPKGSVFPNGFPDWSLPYTFHGMLLHEMGHVFGCGHVADTIMDEDLISKLQTGQWEGDRWAAGGKMYMTNIDHHQILLLKDSTNLSMKGEIHPDRTGEEPRRIFELLVGRKAQGQIEVEVVKTGYQMELFYKDDLGKTSFKLNLHPDFASQFALGGQVFRSMRTISATEEGGFSYKPTGYSYTTSLATAKGKTYVASVAINSDDLGRPIEVKFFDGKNMVTAFRADLWLTHGIK